MDEIKYIVIYHSCLKNDICFDYEDTPEMAGELYTLDEVKETIEEKRWYCTELHDPTFAYETKDDVIEAVFTEFWDGPEDDADCIELVESCVYSRPYFLVEVYALYPNGVIKREDKYCTW